MKKTSLVVLCTVVIVAVVLFLTSSVDMPFDRFEREEQKAEQAVLTHLGNEYSIVEHGAIEYLVKNGERIGGGYHTYFIENGTVYGQIGAITEVVIDDNGSVNRDGGADRFEREG